MPRPAVLFAGQGSDWQGFIATAAQTAATAESLREALAQARSLTGPAARTIASTCPGALERLEQLIAGSTESSPLDALPAVSIPGIVLGQIAAIEQLRDLGVDINERAGHSQGSLGALAVDKPAHALALAILMGTAASAVNGSDPRSQMLSVRGLERGFVTEHLHGTAAIAVVNGRRHFALSGSPEDLAATRTAIEEAVKGFNAELEKRTIGGDELSPRFDELPVALPFHNPVLAMAAERTVALAQKCGLDADEARAQAEAILVNEHDWPATLAALNSEHLIVLDRALTALTRRVVEGTGVTVISAATPQELNALATPGTELPKALNYADFAPRTIELPNGRTYTQTRFSDLTGLSPIMLGGMTPTSADGEIVAAAANAGHWTEMAGGGMYSDEVFRAHLATMEKHLRPGRTAQFNTMFFDRFLWNLHFGQARIVPKARAAGAAFNGVCISAGIPEVEEAGELLDRLHADGFPFISFKPGTAKQIRDVLAIATAYPEDRIIMQVEDGHAGGHHSWVNLDDMLLDTYTEIRQHPNVYLAVGGGIASPDRATSYLTGEWAIKHGLPAMPVDAVFIGTVAMATKEAKATDSVKDLLVNTTGISPEDNDGWVGRGTGAHGVASSQSHLLADIHDLDNSFAAASRLITSLSIEEYPAHRQEIIDALAKTCKPYFGDVESMTYAEWLERFVELAHPFVDPSWDDRFLDLLHRVEARLNPADHGQIETLFTSVEDVHDAPRAVAKLLAEYPAARTTEVSARDAAWWISLHYKHVKPMPWVPAIDGDLKSWFGKDTLWQAQDERYTADQVRIIPGPVAVAGITKKNEPVADLLARFEQATTDALLEQGSTPQKAFSRLNSAADEAAFLRTSPTLLWHGHLMANPAYEMDENAFDLRQDTEGNWEIVITADSYWDDLPEEQRPFYVREVTVPVDLPEDVATGGSPVVSEERLPNSVFTLLEGLAGVGSTAEQGDEITEMPTVESGYSFHFPASLLSAHSAVTCGDAAAEKAGTPDVLVGPCWPAIYAALGSGRLKDGYPVIEGLLNAVHLDHVIDVRVPLEQLADGRQIDVTSSCTAIEESVSGRIVTV